MNANQGHLPPHQASVSIASRVDPYGVHRLSMARLYSILGGATKPLELQCVIQRRWDGLVHASDHVAKVLTRGGFFKLSTCRQSCCCYGVLGPIRPLSFTTNTLSYIRNIFISKGMNGLSSLITDDSCSSNRDNATRLETSSQNHTVLDVVAQ